MKFHKSTLHDVMLIYEISLIFKKNVKLCLLKYVIHLANNKLATFILSDPCNRRKS